MRGYWITLRENIDTIIPLPPGLQHRRERVKCKVLLAAETDEEGGLTVQSFLQLIFGPSHLRHQQTQVVHGMLVGLLRPEVIQRPHVLQEGEGGGEERTSAAASFLELWVETCSTHCFFDDVEALLVYLEGGHLLDDLLQEDVLFIAVAFD